MKKVSQKKNRQQEKERELPFNDLLLPILCVLCIMPFIVYLAEFDTGYSKYSWYAKNSVIQDLFVYYRAGFFKIVSIAAAVILPFRLGLYKEECKPIKVFFPLAGYMAAVMLSTLFSVNASASLTGNMTSFENMFVLLGYGIICFYTYQIMAREKDFKLIINGMLMVSFAMITLGIFQASGHDLVNLEWMQRLILPPEYVEAYLGNISFTFSHNNVYLSLFNPNYAGQFLAMNICFFAVLGITEKDRKAKKILYLAISAVMSILLWLTYSRGALAALIAGMSFYLVFAFLSGRQNKSDDGATPELKKWSDKLKIPLCIVGVCGVFLLVDYFNDFYFMGRFMEKGFVPQVSSIETTADGVNISYADGSCETLTDNDNDGAILFEMPDVDYTWHFYSTENGWKYLNDVGKLDDVKIIPHTDMKGYEYLASGRVFIWSRILPMLSSHILIGTGPDTFPECFPQDDYLGKLYYSKYTAMLIESAHSLYLGTAIQTGVISLICLLVFWFAAIKKSFVRLSRASWDNSLRKRTAVGSMCGCVSYLTAGIFYSSTLLASPLFWIMLGLMMQYGEGQSDQSVCFNSK